MADESVLFLFPTLYHNYKFAFVHKNSFWPADQFHSSLLHAKNVLQSVQYYFSFRFICLLFFSIKKWRKTALFGVVTNYRAGISPYNELFAFFLAVLVGTIFFPQFSLCKQSHHKGELITKLQHYMIYDSKKCFALKVLSAT